MTVKVKVQPVSRVGIAPLVEMAEHMRAELPGWEDTAPVFGRQRTDSDLAVDLAHLARHDGDGFLTASIGEEVAGFGVCYVRSRQLTVSHLWLLPEHAEPRLEDALMRRMLAFGERAGVNEAVASVTGGASQHALLFRHGFRPRFPVYRLSLKAELARRIGQELLKLLAGFELTSESLQRRVGSGDLDRLDRLVRGVVRPMDHEYWISERGLRLATVREGNRVAGYAYGGTGQCGPVAASTPEAALAALGWALHFAAATGADDVSLLVPAPFEAALEQLLDAGATCRAVCHWMSRAPVSGMERYLLPSSTLL